MIGSKGVFRRKDVGVGGLCKIIVNDERALRGVATEWAQDVRVMS